MEIDTSNAIKNKVVQRDQMVSEAKLNTSRVKKAIRVSNTTENWVV